MLITLFFLSGIGGLFSGLLGVGGAVVLIPLMFSVPPLLGVGQLSMHEVAGITMVQVLAASLFGFLSHNSSGHVHRRLVLTIGIPMGAFALLGSTLSKNMPAEYMLIVFGVLVVVAFLMLLKKAPGESQDGSAEVSYNFFGSAAVGSSVGLASGIVGAGGGFVVIPLMIRLLKIPMRVAVGSSLGIVFIGALMGSIGKALTLQVEWLYIIPVIAGSIPASLLGSYISKRMPQTSVRYMLVGVVFLALVNTWKDIFQGL